MCDAPLPSSPSKKPRRESPGVERLCSAQIMHGANLTAAQGSVVSYKGSACVNAANEGCLDGGGVDGAINDRGGEALHAARRALPILDGKRTRCFAGSAKTTIAGDLECEYVIHCVGPNYRMYDNEDAADVILYRAYHSAMLEARAKGLRDVAFCLISAGIFRGSRPLRHVRMIGVLALSAGAYEGLEEVFLVGFTRAEVDTLRSLFDELLIGDDAPAAMQRALATLPPTVSEMHHRALAGTSEPLDALVGFSIALRAACGGIGETPAAVS
jgi:O-acetyl-ADP-ribose deacetylase (regulator of RNase III)